jgi:hypothetical protein
VSHAVWRINSFDFNPRRQGEGHWLHQRHRWSTRITVSMQWLSMFSLSMPPPSIAVVLYKLGQQARCMEQTCQDSAWWFHIKDAIGELFLLALVCVIIYAFLQTHISRPRTPPTLLKSLKYRLMLEYTMILFTSSKWLARHFCKPKINTQLAYAYTKTHHLPGMEDELYQVARLLFTSISNWVCLATTLIYISKNQAAVESA